MHKSIAFLAVAALVALGFVQTPSASGPEALTYQVDPVHSSVVFRITHLGVSAFYGRFNKTTGSFTTNDAGTGSVEITIDANSVDSANDKRDGHLRSPDFFSTKQFPTITFKGDLVKGEGNRYQAKGKLTLRGVTKDLTVDLTRIGSANAMGGDRTGFEGSFKIKRSDYGMTWRPEALGDEVTVMLGIEGLSK
jgi:polyisoprenoid-binding protein YceI